ncbi:MAG: hypothetical protein KDB01_06725 [Planctomycetaceae bacterium]|jgi:hypothetical protein|nr:hypothetical protein [Planctomycetaceae bacterium]
MTTLRQYSTSSVLNNGSTSQYVGDIWIGHTYRRLHSCDTANVGQLSLKANNLLADMSEKSWKLLVVPQDSKNAKPGSRKQICLEVNNQSCRLFLDDTGKTITKITIGPIAAIESSTEMGNQYF